MDDDKFLDPNRLNILPPSKFAPPKSSNGSVTPPTPRRVSSYPSFSDQLPTSSGSLTETPPWMKSSSSSLTSSDDKISYGSSNKSMLKKFSSTQDQKDLAHGSRSSRPSSSSSGPDLQVKHIAPANYGQAKLPPSKRNKESVWAKPSDRKPSEPQCPEVSSSGASSTSSSSSASGLGSGAKDIIMKPASYEEAIRTNRSIQKRVMERMGKLQTASEVPEKKAYKTHNEAFYGLHKVMGTENPAEATHVVEKMVDPKYGSFCLCNENLRFPSSLDFFGGMEWLFEFLGPEFLPRYL